MESPRICQYRRPIARGNHITDMAISMDQCKEWFGKPGLFKGWNEAEIFKAIRSTFRKHPKEMQLILRREFREPNALAILQRHWGNGIWSFGYCFYIAEAAKLMFLSARPGVEFQLKDVSSKKKLDIPLPPELKKHYALFYDDFCFDPEAGHAVLAPERKTGQNRT